MAGGLGLLGSLCPEIAERDVEERTAGAGRRTVAPCGCPVCVRLSSFLTASLQAQPRTLRLSEIKLGVAMRAVIPALGGTEVARS